MATKSKSTNDAPAPAEASTPAAPVQFNLSVVDGVATIVMPSTMTVPVLMNRLPIANLTLDFARINSRVMEYLVAYGVRQSINDAAASGKDEGEKKSLAEKRLDAIHNGTVGIRGGGSTKVPTDPVEVEMHAMAGSIVVNHLKELGYILRGSKANVAKEDIDNLVAEYVVEHGDVLRPDAEATVAKRAALLNSAKIDLSNFKPKAPTPAPAADTPAPSETAH